MRRRRRRQRGDGRRENLDPLGMEALLGEYVEWLRMRNYSEMTIKGLRCHLAYFATWCDERGITRPSDVSRPVLIRYQRWLYHHRREDGRPLSFRSQYAKLSCVRGFFSWLVRNNQVLYNPASELERPRMENRLPRHVLSVEETERVMNEVNLAEPLGIRDRAILETLYSTGMRRMELMGLKLFDLDADHGTVIIRQGKGKKDRIVPIGERALRWIEQYLHHVRPSLAVEPDDGTLFLTVEGGPLSLSRLTQLAAQYVDAAGIGKDGACHLFRHTMATLMLENGADIRFIQQMLGHEQLSTTQVYTRVSIRKLKEIHSKTHPGARLSRRASVVPALAAQESAE